jgi:NAD(P)-dependent dehydrogenase (short-subunit alcohol dehydrogenase family)
MDLKLSGKNVLITGGSKGIGLACARAFLAEGAKVGITSRSQANLDRAVTALEGKVISAAADLIDPEAALAMIDWMESEMGPIDVLVTSAGAAVRTPPAELTPQSWRVAMDAKYFSYINAIDPIVKRMAKRNTGVIVNVIGSGGKIASPAHLAGGAANAALMLITAGLAAAYASQGVRVVGVNPGMTKTQRVSDNMRVDAKISSISELEALKRAEARIPMGRMCEPEEVADTVVYLASARASYVNGVLITMDGVSSPTVM